MGLGQWIIIIILVAIIVFGFVAVFDFSKGVISNVYPTKGSVLHISDTDPFIVANVTRVIDGDTIEIEGGERIRFAIINTPEKWEEGWKEAKDYTTERCLGKIAVIDIDDNQDRTYGRLVGLVYCGGVEGYFINLELLSLQYAVVKPQYCKYSEFKDGILCQFVERE
jgi:endonuclease YncB( thermonuclease family)